MNKLKNFLGNIWVRYSILLLIAIILGFAINYLLYIPVPSLADVNTWLSFYGSIVGAGIAGIITLWGIEYTIKSTILNVKPEIRPVRKDFFLYQRQGTGIFIADEALPALVKKQFDCSKIQFSDIDKLEYSGILKQLSSQHEGTKLELFFSQIDVNKLYNEIKQLCSFKTYSEAMNLLSEKLPNMYKHGAGEQLYPKIYEKHYDDIASSVMIDLSMNWNDCHYYLYNIGAGNASDIRVEWSFKKNYHISLCKALDFSKKEYEDMNNSFSFENVQAGEADVLLNTNENNKIQAAIPTELILFIKLIHRKSEKNIIEKHYAKNNVLIGENPIAELTVSCVDIHGKQHSTRYRVMFKISSTLRTFYDTQEKIVSLKFDRL